MLATPLPTPSLPATVEAARGLSGHVFAGYPTRVLRGLTGGAVGSLVFRFLLLSCLPHPTVWDGAFSPLSGLS